MRLFRMFGVALLLPQNDTDRFLLQCMGRETKAQKVEIMAVERSGREHELKGVMFCEYVKNRDASFKPWPEGSLMARLRKKERSN
jgi:hypothetical protein